ncbi:hypothetical protein [Microbacterium sp. E-13]|uniref:hypothetical protein n=1 Tax=Microbacterium sp. E-13 TaxID=3404048 RepID=UPI003CF1E4DB
MDAKAGPELQPKKSTAGLLWGCIGCITLPIAIIAAIIIYGAATPDKPYDANNKYEAIAQCEARIKDMLKAPSTAEFHSDAAGNGTWTVTGTVDAENGFGAMIRNDFECTVRISGDRATTTVNYLE